MTALDAEFMARAFVVPHVVMHVFGILLNAARIGFEGRTLARTTAACRAYVDDLVAQQKLDLPIARPNRLETDSGYDGLGFIGEETAEFRALRAYFDAAIDKAWRDTLPAVAAELHELLKAEPERFTQQTTINNSPAPAARWDVPLLQHIAPEAFAQSLLALPPMTQVTVIQGLASRYQRPDNSEVRTTELPWLAEVHGRLRAAMPTLGAMSRYRLKTALARDLEPLLPPNRKPAKPALKPALKPKPKPKPKLAMKPKPAAKT